MKKNEWFSLFRYVKNNKFENVKEKFGIIQNMSEKWEKIKFKIMKLEKKTYCKRKLSFEKTVKKIL